MSAPGSPCASPPPPHTVPPMPSETTAANWRACVRLLAAGGDYATTLVELLTLIGEATGARDVRLLALDEGYARVITSAGADGGDDWPFGETPAFQAVALGMPILTPLAADSPYAAVRALSGPGALLHLPLLSAGTCLGVLELVSATDAPAFALSPDDAVAWADLVTLLLASERQRDALQHMEVAWRKEVRARGEDRRQIGDQLLHAARLTSVGELTAGLLPDLAQAILVIQSTVELLQRESNASPLIERSLPVVARASARIATLVRQIRDHVREDTQPTALVDLRELAIGARDLCPAAQRQAVHVLGNPGVRVPGDRARLEQLIVHLVLNAVEVGGAPVRVQVGWKKGADGPAQIIVSDRGPGVPPELRARIFEPLYTTRPGGRGMGLALCAQIVAEHHGIIEVDDHLGGGTRMVVTLPARVEPGR